MSRGNRENNKESVILRAKKISKPVNMEPAKTQEMLDPEIGPNINATGQLQWRNIKSKHFVDGNVAGVRWGSGVLISKNYFLTAAHCFSKLFGQDGDFTTPSYMDSSIRYKLEPDQLCKLMKVNFRYHGRILPESERQEKKEARQRQKSYKILKLVERQLTNDLDYAIVKLEGEPGNKFGWVTMGFHKINATSSFNVYCIHHPDGLPMKYSESEYPTFTMSQAPTKLHHAANTLPGSSGAGIFDRVTHKLLAVHIQGFSGKQVNRNKGVLLTAIYRNSRALRKVIRKYKDLKKLYKEEQVREIKKSLFSGGIFGALTGLAIGYYQIEKNKEEHSLLTYGKYAFAGGLLGASGNALHTMSKRKKNKEKRLEELNYITQN